MVFGTSTEKRTAVVRSQRGARYGSGTLVRRAGANGDTWIAKWRDGGRQVQRGLEGKVIVSVYSSGAIGRLLPEDVAGLVNYLKSTQPA